MSEQPTIQVHIPRPPPVDPMQRAANALVRTLTAEFPKLDPAERREFLVQSIDWMRHRIAEMDETRRRAQPAVTAEPTKVEAPTGKGTRSSDLMAA